MHAACHAPHCIPHHARPPRPLITAAHQQVNSWSLEGIEGLPVRGVGVSEAASAVGGGLDLGALGLPPLSMRVCRCTHPPPLTNVI